MDGVFFGISFIDKSNDNLLFDSLVIRREFEEKIQKEMIDQECSGM